VEGTMEIVIKSPCLIGMKHVKAGTQMTVSKEVGRHLVLMQRAVDVNTPKGKAWLEAWEEAHDEDKNDDQARAVAEAAAAKAAEDEAGAKGKGKAKAGAKG